MPFAEAPENGDLHADVAIVGAGPAGAASALVLARAGIDVVLVDRAAFPRDKTCGDGLMPDALASLRALGVADRTLAGALHLRTLQIYAPNGGSIRLNGEFAVVPRRRFDACLCEAAVEAGARLVAPARAVAPLDDGGRVAGVIARTAVGGGFAVHAPVTVLATGAGAGPLMAFGVCARSEPSAIAERFYVTLQDDEGPGLDALCVSFDRSVCPGYAWIFPGPDRTFNVGVGYPYEVRHRIGNVRDLVARFTATFPPARDLLRRTGRSSVIAGAPLRTGLTGSRLSRPGLLVAGEAAGLTYPVSGEGIGKAIASGMIAADTIREGFQRGRSSSEIAAAYAATIEAKFAARYEAYRRAERWVGHPALFDFVVSRANKGRYLRAQFEALAADLTDPAAVLSLAGVIRSLLF